MALSTITTSDLTSEPEDLTVIHEQSGLPGAHETRRTQDGFLIESSRLPNYIPLPTTNKPPRSWVWDQGHAIGKKIDGCILRYWLFKTCYSATVHHPLSYYLLPAFENTTKVIDHLERRHLFDRHSKQRASPTSKKRKRHDL